MASITQNLIEQVQIDSGDKYSLASTAYGVCSTAASTAIKDVEMRGFTLIPGVTIHVKFSNANSANNPQLKFNNEADENAKNIVQYGVVAAGTNASTDGWEAGAVLSLTYDGTSWVKNSGYNTDTTYSTFIQSGSSAAAGLVPAPSTTAGTTKFLREDATWQTALTEHQDLSAYATLASPTFTGTPKSVTPTASSDGTMIATKAYVDNQLGVADALVFQGTLNGASPTAYTPIASRGDTYKVNNNGLINGLPVEVGDLLICINDTAQADSSNVSTIKENWAIVQNNVDGAVYKGTNSFTDAHVIIADETNGKVKDSGYTIAANVPSGAIFTDENVTATANTATTFYLIGSSSSSTATGTMLKSQDIFYTSSDTSGNRYSELVLGNTTKIDTSGGREGRIRLHGDVATYYINLAPATGLTANQTVIFPGKTGTLVVGETTTTANAIAKYSDTTATLANSAATIDDNGNITATSFIGILTGNANTATAFATAPKVKVSLSTTYGTGTGESETTLNANNGEQTLAVTGILPVKHGGTGVDTLTSGYALIGNGTSAVNFRQIVNNVTATAIEADTTNNSLVTVNTVYYGLPTINYSHNYTSNTTIYAPSAGGTANHILIGKGTTTAPDWTLTATLSGDSNEDLLTLGALNKQGKIELHSSGTTTTTIQAQEIQSGNSKIFYLPNYNDNMYAVHVGSTAAVGSSTKPVYVAANGRITASDSDIGDPYTPMYLDNGEFSASYPVQYFTWTITSGNVGVSLTGTDIFKINTYGVTIVVTSGEENLNTPLTWTSSTNPDTFTISSSEAVSGNVSGYAIVSRGADITGALTSTAVSSGGSSNNGNENNQEPGNEEPGEEEPGNNEEPPGNEEPGSEEET